MTVRGRLASVAIVAVTLLLTAALSGYLGRTDVATAQEPSVGVAPAPAPGGLTQVIAGTTDIQALISAQTFAVESVWKLDIATQRYLSYIVGAPDFANTLTSSQVTDIVTMRAAPAEISRVVFEFSDTTATAEDPRLLAVAFQSVTFIDSDGRPTGELTFGTSAANELQEDGWFGDESSPAVGAFQWAGGPSATASMQLQIPRGTEGLLFRTRAVVDGTWVTVSVDGALSATLRVGAYWTSGYAPLGEAPPWAARVAAPQWSDGRYYPRFPSTDRVYVIRVRSALEDAVPGETLPWMSKHRIAWEPDFRINHSHETAMALTLVGMQGVINRSGPSVYIDWGDDFTGASRFWVP